MTCCGESVGAFADDGMRRERWTDCRRRDVVQALDCLQTTECSESVRAFADDELLLERWNFCG